MESSIALNNIINYIRKQIIKLNLEQNEIVQDFIKNFEEIDQKCAEDKISLIVKYLQDINYEDFAAIFFNLFGEKNFGIFKNNIRNNPLLKKIERIDELQGRIFQFKIKMEKAIKSPNSEVVVNEDENVIITSSQPSVEVDEKDKPSKDALIECTEKKDNAMMICTAATQEEEIVNPNTTSENHKERDCDIEYLHREIDTLSQEILKEKDDFYLTCSSIIGAFLGDAMGSFCEFSGRDESNHERIWTQQNVFYLPRGQITDDSEMALSLCYSLMDGKNIREMEDHLIYMYYGLWSNSGPFDMGATTYRALCHINDSDRKSDINMHNQELYAQAKPKIKTSNFSSLSNGFLMRISPLAAWIFFKEKELIRKACVEDGTYEALVDLYSLVKSISHKETETSHSNSEALSAAAFYIFMILNCLMRISASQVIKNMKTLVLDERFQTEDRPCFRVFSQILNSFDEDNSVAFNHKEFNNVGSHSIGYYLHAFRLCIFYLKHLDQMITEGGIDVIYRRIMYDICNLGGDTDTNCCIVGAVIGPLVGVENFGEEVTCLIKYVNEDRYMYSSAYAVYFIKFLEEKFGEVNNETLRPYPYNFLKMVLGLLTIPDF